MIPALGIGTESGIRPGFKLRPKLMGRLNREMDVKVGEVRKLSRHAEVRSETVVFFYKP